MRSSFSCRIADLIATCLGLGRAPVAPGTAGSLGAVALGALLAHFRGWEQADFALLAAVSLAPGIWAAHVVSRASGEEDPSRIVVDEAIGQWVTLAGAAAFNWKSLLAGFLLFRAFDIWKPPPVRQAERLAGGVGIVADDVAAGLYGALVLFAAGCFNLY
ncbi:MAG TPA: phosphatidylglycerophosphatase A [Bryobacteraceae bacterium]|nr:phosphatidylglycerophosphatase A [Bryobacteraceae bacterium]